MQKTTLYLPDELKADVEDEARRSGRSEAEVIRSAVAAAVKPVRPRPRAGVFSGKSIARRVDELLAERALLDGKGRAAPEIAAPVRGRGGAINAGAGAAAVRQRFIERLDRFLNAIQVVNSPAVVRRLARRLPGQERRTSAKMREQTAHRRFPERFNFSKASHRVRVATYDREQRAHEAREQVQPTIPSLPLRVERYGQRSYGLYTGPLSHFEAIVAKHAIDRAASTGPGGALVEARPSTPSLVP